MQSAAHGGPAWQAAQATVSPQWYSATCLPAIVSPIRCGLQLLLARPDRQQQFEAGLRRASEPSLVWGGVTAWAEPVLLFLWGSAPRTLTHSHSTTASAWQCLPPWRATGLCALPGIQLLEWELCLCLKNAMVLWKAGEGLGPLGPTQFGFRWHQLTASGQTWRRAAAVQAGGLSAKSLAHWSTPCSALRHGTAPCCKAASAHKMQCIAGHGNPPPFCHVQCTMLRCAWRRLLGWDRSYLARPSPRVWASISTDIFIRHKPVVRLCCSDPPRSTAGALSWTPGAGLHWQSATGQHCTGPHSTAATVPASHTRLSYHASSCAILLPYIALSSQHPQYPQFFPKIFPVFFLIPSLFF